MREIVLEAPSWVGEEEARRKFWHYLMGEALMKSEYYRSLMKPFERKYSTSFLDFKKKIETSERENFQAWDDLIEWEAYYRVYTEWNSKYEELKRCLKE